METSSESSILVLGPEACKLKIKRIAYQIWEHNPHSERILLAGIKNRGLELALQIAKELRNISDLEVETTFIRMNKENPVHDEITIGVNPADYTNIPIVVVDDVANSGKTLLYALKPFMDLVFDSLQIAVLVDRKHKAYPVSPDFVGLSLATTLHSHITVNFDNDEVRVYLDS